MTTKQSLKAEVAQAEAALLAAKRALEDFECLPENNVYESMEEAENKIENALLGMASDDCEGAHNCGNDEYRRKFMVGGVMYEGVLTVEYDRHDKTYYYIDRSDFTVVPA